MKPVSFLLRLVLLLGFAGMAVFGLLQFSHAGEMPMINCPYAEGGFALCDNGLNHISNWQQFLNVIFPVVLALVLALGLAVAVKDFLNPEKYFYRYRSEPQPVFAYSQYLTKWLALHENSPSRA